MAIPKRNLQINSISIDLNICKPNLISHLFHSKSKSKQSKSLLHFSDATVSSRSSDSESPPFSDSDSETRTSRTFRRFGRTGGESVAVEKYSDDPYLDFRHSMVQMILENEIYSKEDLREMLKCFLELNKASHHGIIVRAFGDIWDSVFSVRTSAAAGEVRVFNSNV